ncbi:CoA activase [candidate division KSB1 bacterium]|nr:CoA activase [candidate division KSB1 bacterium]
MTIKGEASVFLGIDIGAVSLSYALIEQNARIIRSEYIIHQGNIVEILQNLLNALDLSTISQIAYNHKSADFFSAGASVNEQVALITGIRTLLPEAKSIFNIGGETFGLFLFDEQNRYQRYISNSSCAAGTGAFLDQQAERLGLHGSAELSQLAEKYSGAPPKIATRCAVFAKTDLIHCQQQGYSIEAISAGLCKGLARNIYDTLIKGVDLHKPIAVIGGVSKNQKVMHYLSELIGYPVMIPESALIAGAIGSALYAMKNQSGSSECTFSPDHILRTETSAKHYFFSPLASELSVFPDFDSHSHYLAENVEVDIYALPDRGSRIPVYMGVDIGSTSTKALIMEASETSQRILLGLYTRTMGQPVNATQSLFKALADIEAEHGIEFEFIGVGTTGSGRKFIQKVINADLAIDEITAHARAAHALNPDVDTIIEIGGQDSKFTIMKNAQVTFSVMNYVCAAGTGSFIEEQAKRLNVPLHEYSDRAVGTASPLTSDRCTVFMERDLNHFMSQGYSKNELLAAVLHSVRDNYLSKVAHLNKIGNVLCFQGATAKNKALVMAFEQKLHKPIFVSRYCHLTGALGICLLLKEQEISDSKFRGIAFYKETLTVQDDICDGCQNHCKLKRIQIADENIVWGYLCGRDESSIAAKSRNRSGFDLLSARRRIFHPKQQLAADQENPLPKHPDGTEKSFLDELKAIEFDVSLEKLKESVELNLLNLRHLLFSYTQDDVPIKKPLNEITIGIPNTLHLQEVAPFWEYFFTQLGYSVKLSSAATGLLERGKQIVGAEFCAPISYWHGHVEDIGKRVDYVFLPHIFEDKDEENTSKFYCYYSGYAASMLYNLPESNLKNKYISPIIDFSKAMIDNIQQIYENLPQALKFTHTPGEISEAYVRAWRWFSDKKKQLVDIFQEQKNRTDDISIVLLGRPYLVLDPVMNKNIPQKFNQLDLKTYFQDMLPPVPPGLRTPAREFIEWNHWKFGATILRAADYVGRTPGLYPVLLTAFKCSPDSFVLNYFRSILDDYLKPYLVLQIDEHGSDVGYETRIESATLSFRNHFNHKKSLAHSHRKRIISRTPDEKSTILIPNYDRLSCSLISAAFEHAGYRAILIEETSTSILSSLRLNDGQCLPISALVSAAVDTIHKYRLKPEDCAIFINAIIRTACNLPQYPLMMKKMLEQRGEGYEKVQIFATEFEMRSLPLEIIYDVYCSFLLGGLLRRIGCKLRPYELIPGQTNQVIESARAGMFQCIVAGSSKELAFKEAINDFARIPLQQTRCVRPKVTIIGDLYIRDNDVFNQELVAELEAFGAEVVTTPYTYILRMLAKKHTRDLYEDGRYFSLFRDKLLMEVLEKFEKRFYDLAYEIMQEEFPLFDAQIFDNLKKYNLSFKHGGETVQNLLKIFSLLRHYPDLSLFIHVNPIFCCPGLVSESIFKMVEKDIGIPIVSIIYDGTTTNRNEILAPYMYHIQNPIS